MKQAKVRSDLEIAQMDAKDLQDQSTAELEKNIADIEEINRKIRMNLDKEKAEMEAQEYAEKYYAHTEKIEAVRKARTDLLEKLTCRLKGSL